MGTSARVVLLCAVALTPALGHFMNGGGVPYKISNEDSSTGASYNTDFETNAGGKVEHFDVYGEVRTVYSQVYWTRNAPIQLPKDIVERFKGKTIAITGYEVDQVTHSGPEKGSSTSPDGSTLGGFSCYPSCDAGDKSVPIYFAYNHHYFSWLVGADSEMYEEYGALPNPTRTAFRNKPGVQTKYPTNIVFKENPGGEFRKSYHGYPRGFAQLLHSPTQWVVEPMQIDTHNRNFNLTDQPGYKPWFLPKRDTINASMTNLDSSLSPLIECPCTDRITKTQVNISRILTSGKTCKATIQSLDECASAAKNVGANVLKVSSISTAHLPRGCILKPRGNPGHKMPAYDLEFNSDQTSTAGCGTSQSGIEPLGGSVRLGNLTQVQVTHNGTTAIITITGPSDVWFGVGFGASAMSGLPYAIIVDGETGSVSERKLANHGPGRILSPVISVLSNTVDESKKRTVQLMRPVKAPEDYFTIPTTPGRIDLITAVGSGPKFSYHKSHTGGSLTLIPTQEGDDACLCAPSPTTYFTYMDTSVEEFDVQCIGSPRSDMKSHGDGTGRNVPNMACSGMTYGGGLRCCKHKYLLTDRAQDKMILKDRVDKYFLKWRYYFQEYHPRRENVPASHLHLHHWVFLIDANVNDYEEDNEFYGHHSIGKITANLTARDMGIEDIPKDGFKTLSPIVMTPHCHAPSCIREELWNVDSGEIICNVSVSYGNGKNGDTRSVFNEENYVAIPPCLWGYQGGLQKPLNITPDTSIMAVKYFNNTFRHYGQMAQWTGLLVYDSDPY